MDRRGLSKYALPEISKTRKEPYDYQSDAIEDALDAILGKESKAQVHFATGLGKSIVLAEVARYFLEKDSKSKVLLLAEQITLISQLESTMWPQLSQIYPLVSGVGKNTTKFLPILLV